MHLKLVDIRSCDDIREIYRKIGMKIRPLRTRADHQAAMEAAAPYVENEPVPSSDAADRFEQPVMLIE